MKKITIEEYNKKMDKIATLYKHKPIGDCLIAMLDEACKYQIVDANEMVTPTKRYRSEVKNDTKRKKKVG